MSRCSSVRFDSSEPRGDLCHDFSDGSRVSGRQNGKDGSRQVIYKMKADTLPDLVTMYRKMIAEDIRLFRAMADAARRCDELELITQELSITTFRCVPRDLRPKLGQPAVERYPDMLNRRFPIA